MKLSVPNRVVNLFLLVSMIGVIDSAYLTYSHLVGGDAGCFLVEGCDLVLTSPYSEVFGIPVALFGLLFYTGIFFGFLFYNFKRGERLLKLLSYSTALGLLASIWFVYLQMFVIKAYCTYCLLSAITSTILFILGVYVLRSGPKDVVVREDLTPSV